jgi:hypothetical protein
MPGASTQVSTIFTNAQNYAKDAQLATKEMITALNAINFDLPPITVAASNLPPVPTIDLPPISPLTPITIPSTGTTPMDISELIPAIDITPFTDLAPTMNLPSLPTISTGAIPVIPSLDAVTLPDAPLITLPTIPSLPAVSTVLVPSAPEITLPTLPAYLAIDTVTFTGVNMHEDWLTKLSDMPTMMLAAPTPYSYAQGDGYQTQMLAYLQTRLAGGTGLSAAVEQAIWDRSRDRETKIAQANVSEVMRKSESLGFVLPTGALSAQMREAEQAYYDKLSELSRDVSVKQAEMEQENLKQAITLGIQLEGQLIDQAYKMEQLAFETAKTYADNAISIYNAQTDNFKTLLAAYSTYSEAYRTLIQAEMTKVEAFKAQISGEQTKAQINTNMVQQYKTEVDASMSHVEIYKAQVGAAQVLVQLEQAKIGIAGEQIRAYVAQVNAETSKIEVFKAQISAVQSQVQLGQAKIGAAGEQVRAYSALVGAEVAKTEVYKYGVQAEGLKLEAYKANASAHAAVASAQGEKARAEISRFSAIAQAKSVEWEGYRARGVVASETAKAQAMQNSALLDADRASIAAAEAKANMHARVWEAGIKQYEAQQTITLQTARASADSLIATNTARADAAKVGAQVYAQWTSSAYAMMHAQASISGSDSTSYNYNAPVAQVATMPGSVLSP